MLIVAAVAAVVVIVVVIAVLMGNSSTKSTPSTTSSTPPTTIVFNPAHNARFDVTTGACTATNGGWTYSGTVTNHRDNARRYQIVVDFISVPGDTVLDTQIANLTVNGHSTASWTVHGATGTSNTNCVIRYAQAWNS
jgi:uncharacterized protein with FMN-binding domain